MASCTFHSPIGPLAVVVDDRGQLTEMHFGHAPDEAPDDATRAVCAQLGEYFAGTRKEFEVKLAPRGTEFQMSVWMELLKIPYGGTISYSELAQRIGKPSAVRAVGAANGANPIPVIIPCHRVIGSNGSLTGYGGGTERKQRLLVLEGRRLF